MKVQARQQRAERIEIPELQARSILTETRGFTGVTVPGTGFHYSLNPYRGCAFNCSYCYAPAFVFDENARANWVLMSRCLPRPHCCRSRLPWFNQTRLESTRVPFYLL
ncbi:MAG: hypothetical protein H0X37_06055 [Herpetosiphonaceae bacterium]|nr:hypothetical protein [Herpetosiphonaceae bacterium]